MARRLELARLFYRIEAESRGLDAQLRGAERSFGRTADFIKAHPVAAAGALGVALLGAAVKATQAASAFEKSMAEISTLVDTTAVDMKQLSDGVLELFKSLPVESLDDLTRGLYNVISAGVPAADALDFLRVAAEASVGGVTDVNTAVDGLTTAVNAFASRGLTATDAADAFFVAVKAGKTTFAEISAGIGQTASLANSLGVSLDDLLANMVALTKGGVSTSQAFTSLRAIFSNILKPTKEFRDEFPQLAQDFDVAALKSKGLTQFMTELAARLQGNTTAASKMFGSVEGLNAALALTANEGAAVRDVMEQMASKAGASDGAFDKMKNTTANLHQVLKNQFNAAMVELGTLILPTVNTGLQAFVGFLHVLTGAARALDVQGATTSITNLANALARATANAQDTSKSSAQVQAAWNAVSGATDGLVRALSTVVAGSENALTSITQLARRTDQINLGKRTAEHLQALERGFRALVQSGTLTEKELTMVAVALNRVGQEMVQRNIPALDATTKAVTQQTDALKTTTDAGKTLETGTGKLTEAQKKAQKQFQDTTVKGVLAWGDAMARTRKIAIETSVTIVDDLQAALEDLQQELRTSGIEAERVERALKPLRDELALVKLNERLELPEILKKSAAALSSFDLSRLNSARLALEDLVRNTTEGSKERKAVEDQIAAIQAVQIERQGLIVKGMVKTADAAARVRKENDTTNATFEETVRQVTNIASGALGVAQAFGLVDSNTARVLQNIISIGTALPKAFTGDISAVTSVIGNLAGVISSLFGESPETKARKKLLRDNTNALDALTRTNGDLVRLSTPGAELARAQEALADFGRRRHGFEVAPVRIERRDLLAALSAQGLDLSALERIADDLGLVIRNPASGNLEIGALEQLFEALRNLDTARGESFQDELDNIRSLIRIGVLEPAQEFAATLEAIRRVGAPGLTGALAGIDPFTEAGRAEATKALQDLFLRLSRGELTKAELGDLTRTEFAKAIEDLVAFLQSEDPIKAVTPSDPLPVESPALTAALENQVVAAAAQAGLLTDQLSVSTRQADLLEEILVSLARFQPVAPPAVPEGLFGGAGLGGGVTVSGPITITVQVAAGTDAAAQGAVAARAFTNALVDRGLFNELRLEGVWRGDPRYNQ
jgi:TP901 family phage tail tape measure protein